MYAHAYPQYPYIYICRALELDAYRLAIDALKCGMDTDTYKKVSQRVGMRLGEKYAYDHAWVENVEKRVAQVKERLENDLCAARTNLVKESIRMVRHQSPTSIHAYIHTYLHTSCIHIYRQY